MSVVAKAQARRCALQAMYELDQGSAGESLAGVFADEAETAGDVQALDRSRAWTASRCIP